MDHQIRWDVHAVDTPVWLESEDYAFEEAKVVAVEPIDGDEDGAARVTVQTKNGTRVTVDTSRKAQAPKMRSRKGQAPRKLLPRSMESNASSVENMDDLSPLNYASILSNVDYRFRLDEIYTRTGPILIALNPFKWLPIYGNDTMMRYKGKPYGEFPPHPYQEAEDAFQNIRNEGNNQAIIICGESGAGKTETTKLMLQYLATVARRGEAGSGTEDLGERLVGSNPLMEAFGNAKTLRNHNSSRFGKFTQLNYDNMFTICGGEIKTFLLEKARVVEPSQGERNYHIFYQLLEGAPADIREAFLLGGIQDYRCLSMTGCYAVDGLSDNDEFDNTMTSMDAVNISEDERMEILQIVAGVLHLENVEFAPSPDEESCRISEVAALSAAGKCLGVSSAELGDALIKRVRKLPSGQEVVSPQTATQSSASRDALGKAVYSALFDWLVRRINATLNVSGTQPKHLIGILDIFGFEEMPTNSFEQLLINFTNEKLQQLFNLAVFQEEAEEYERQQIQWDKTEFPDNNLCIELIEKKPMGLIPFMESECSRGAAAGDQNLVSKWHKTYVGNPFYGVCGPSTQWKHRDGSWTDATDFVIKHYAGPVIYSIDGFVKKNLDALFPHLASVCATSSSNIMQSLFPNTSVEDNRAGRATVAGHYLTQLTELTKTLKASDIRFVRCIKTNDDFSPQVVDRPSVLRQLVCSGVMAALAIRRSGFPTRIPYEQFVREFKVFSAFVKIDPEFTWREQTHRMMTCDTVADRVTPDDYRFGTSKLFLRADVLLTLQSMRNSLILPFVVRIQKWWLRGQEDILSHKLKRAIQFLSDNVGLAERYGVKNQAKVRETMNEAISAVRYAKGLTMSGTNAFRSALNVALERNTVFKKAILSAKEKRDEEAKQRAELLTLVDEGRTRLGRIRDGINGIYQEFDIQYLVDTVQSAHEAISGCRNMLIMHANRTAVKSQSANPANFASSALQRTFTKAVMELQSLGESTDDDVDLEERSKQVHEAIELVDGAQRIFDDIQQKQFRVDEARATYGNALQQTIQLLEQYESKAEELGIITSPPLASAISHARDAVNAAEAALSTTEVQAYEPTTQNAQDAVDRVGQVFEEECGVKAIEDQRNACRLELEEEKKKLEQLVQEAQNCGIASRQPVQDALMVADEAIRAAALQQVGDVEEFEESVRRAGRQVAAFEFVCARERERKEVNDRLREQEMLRLDQCADALKDLEQRVSLEGLGDCEALVLAVEEAGKQLERARATLEKSEDVNKDRGVVEEVFASIQNAEQHFISEKQTRDAARRDAARVQQELQQIEQRFNDLCGIIDASGKVVQEVLEPYRDAAATDIKDAKRIIRRTEQQGLHPRDCFESVAAAEQSIVTAEEQLDEIRRVLSQTERTRNKESETLAEAEATLEELQASKTVQKTREGPLRDAISRAVAECGQARSRLDRPITAAWMFADELAGDLAAVAAALQAVYAAENMAREAEREAAILERHAKLNQSTLELEENKLAELESFAAELGLTSVPAVASAFEECHENLNTAKRLCAVVEEAGPDGTSRQAEQDAAQNALKITGESISAAEKIVSKAKADRDASEKLRASASAQIDSLSARLQGLVAALAAAGPEVQQMCESGVQDATEALNEATKLLRRGADAATIAPAVSRAEDLIIAAENNANKLRRRVGKAHRERAAVEAQLASLNETLALAKEKAAACMQPVVSAEEGGDASAGPLFMPATIEEAISKADKALAAAQAQLDTPISAWLSGSGNSTALVNTATSAVQNVEEVVDDAVQKLEIARKAVERVQSSLKSLQSRHAVVVEGAAELKSADSLVLSEKIAKAESELNNLKTLVSAIEAEPTSASREVSRSITSAEESVRQEESSLQAEQQKTRLRNVEISDARRCLPVLKKQIAAVDALVNTSGAALVGHMCSSEVAAAHTVVHEVERYVTFEGVGTFSRSSGPRLVEYAFSVVNAADHAVRAASVKVQKVSAQRSTDMDRLKMLDAHYRSVGERLAEMCTWSDALRLHLEAEWGETNWFGSQTRFTTQNGTPAGRNEVSPQGSVTLIKEAVVAAETSMNVAKRRVEGSVSQWLEVGALVVRRSIEDAILKTAALEDVVDAEYAKLQRESAHRRSVQEALEAQVTRFQTAKALAEDVAVMDAPGVRQMLTQAENAINAITELLSSGTVSGSAPALDECNYKVSTCCDHINTEVEKAERKKAEAQACITSLTVLRQRLDSLRECVAISECKDDSEVDLTIGRADAAISTGLQLAASKNLTHSSVALSRSLMTSTMSVENAERVFSRSVARKEELRRLKQRREFMQKMHDAKQEQLRSQTAYFEQMQRDRLRRNMQEASQMLESRQPAMDMLTQKMKASQDALLAARKCVDSDSIASASKALANAIRELQAIDYATSAMNDSPIAGKVEAAALPAAAMQASFVGLGSDDFSVESRTRALAEKLGYGETMDFPSGAGHSSKSFVVAPVAHASAPQYPFSKANTQPMQGMSITADEDAETLADGLPEGTTSSQASPSNTEWTMVGDQAAPTENGIEEDEVEGDELDEDVALRETGITSELPVAPQAVDDPPVAEQGEVEEDAEIVGASSALQIEEEADAATIATVTSADESESA